MINSNFYFRLAFYNKRQKEKSKDIPDVISVPLFKALNNSALPELLPAAGGPVGATTGGGGGGAPPAGGGGGALPPPYKNKITNNYAGSNASAPPPEVN